MKMKYLCVCNKCLKEFPDNKIVFGDGLESFSPCCHTDYRICAIVKRNKMIETNNSIIKSLYEGPKTTKELPYKPTLINMSIKNARLIRKIKVSGRKIKTNTPFGNFITIYYLENDIDIAIDKFIEVNKSILKNMDFKNNQGLHSGLPKGLGKKIIEQFKIKEKMENDISI